VTEQSIFLAALEIADPAERSAYLGRACGRDAALRGRVEELLAAHERPGAFLDVPACEQMAAGPPPPVTDTVALEGHAEGEDVVAVRRDRPAADRTEGGPPGGGDEIDLNFLGPSARPGSLGRLGHYEVLEVLGHGGFGIVLKAFDERLHRVVAIKVMAPQLASTSPARKRFLREARASAAIRHENVVDIHFVEEQPIPYLVMEYVAGETLQQKLNRVGPLEAPEVLRIGRQVAGGLAAAHAMGLVHRDIKPSNVLLESGVEQRVKITDFGLARAADDASLTQSGFIAGTPMYMAPEQARGEAIDHRADLFSLGSVLYVMYSGRPPFRASTTLAVLKRVTDDVPRPIREIIPEVPEWLCAVVARLHAKRPEDRFGSAREVADLLRRYLAQWQQGACRYPPRRRR
jgi:serine/threonine protein kinase